MAIRTRGQVAAGQCRSSLQSLRLMPSRDLHRRLAVENEQIAVALLGISPSWSAVIAFYSALHWVDAFLDHSIATHPGGHRQREIVISRLSALQPIARTYQRLRDGSEGV